MTIDINELREAIQTFGSQAINESDLNELLDRLELTESREAVYKKAFEISEKTAHDLTEKVIPNIRDQLETAEKERDELRAKIEAIEKQKPIAWISSRNGFIAKDNKNHEYNLPLIHAFGAQPTPSIPEGWLRAIDEALVVANIGVANASDTYEQAKAKLDSLIGFHVDVATDPAVNGGYKLVSVRLTPKTKGVPR